MTRFNISGFLLLVSMTVILNLSVRAEVPGTMNYQGRLTDNAGNPVSDTPHNVTFRIYDETSTVRWEESHELTTVDGFFSVQLGSNGSPLTGEAFDYPECWLGITVDTDSEISPRTRLNTVPYAFRTGGVKSGEIIDEPGVAAFTGAYYVYLEDLAFTVLSSLTITCPSAGYVMAVAHGRIATLPQHTTGTNSYALVGISDEPNSLPANQDLDFHIPEAAPSGTYSFPFGMTSMFTVPSAGSYTYYYLAYEYSGSVSVADMQFNLVFFPTAYGTVDTVPDPGSGIRGILENDISTRLSSPVQPGFEVERQDLRPVDVFRLEQELAALKARVDTLQRLINNNDH